MAENISDKNIKTVSDEVFETFIETLGQQDGMEETAQRLKEAIFNGQTLNDKNIRAALFEEGEE